MPVVHVAQFQSEMCVAVESVRGMCLDCCCFCVDVVTGCRCCCCRCCCCCYSSAAMFPSGQQVPRNNKLKNTVAGAVSVARDGSDFAISLGRALKLDETHQVATC